MLVSLAPYIVCGPAQICFSGGRTSGFMLHEILQANEGLPADCHVLFQNTGKEREETLVFIDECARRWNVPITWLEWDGFNDGQPQRMCRYRTVTFETASRNGEPFATLNSALGMLPNPPMRLCTANLKVRTGGAYMRGYGFDEWDSVMGIRADEPGRVARMLNPARDNRDGYPVLPLARANVSKSDVLNFWREQPFDLQLDPQGDLGNCDLCFLKARRKIVAALVKEAEQLRCKRCPQLNQRRLRVQAGLGKTIEEVLFPIKPLMALGHGIDNLGVDAQRLAGFAKCTTRTIGRHRRGYRGTVAAIFPVDVLNDLFPSLVFKVDVDVGRLAPLFRDKTLEKHVASRRVDFCHTQAVTDR